MSDALHIRRATAADIPVMLEAMEAFYRFEKIPFDAPHQARLLAELVADPALGDPMLLEEKGRLAGYFVLAWCFSLEFGGRFALLDELYVDPAFRGGGRAARAIEAAIADCHERGVTALRLEVTEGNDRAANLYRHHGFRTDPRRLMTLRLAHAGA